MENRFRKGQFSAQSAEQNKNKENLSAVVSERRIGEKGRGVRHLCLLSQCARANWERRGKIVKTSQKIIVVSCTCLLVIVSVGCAAAARKLYTAKAERRAAKEAAQNIEKEFRNWKRSGRTRKEQAQREAEEKRSDH